jgi:hypothetical protein
LYEDEKKDPEKAKLIWQRLASIKPSFPWERNLVSVAEKSLKK